MGAIRHRQLIQWLAFAVALDMAVGVVALSARRSGRGDVRATLVAGPVGIPLNDKTGTGVLAGANLNDRRTSRRSTGSTSVPPSTAATQPPAGVGTETAAPTTASSSSTTTTGRSPSTGPAGAAPSTRPTSSTTRPAAPSASTGPAATSSTTATTRPSTTTTARPTATTATTSRPPAAQPPSGDVGLTDQAGDTFVDGSQKAIKEPRADIIQAGAAYRPGLLGLVMQVQQPVDPRSDERWAGDATFVLWSLDTTGDGQPDFEIQYYVLEGELGGVVSAPASTDPLCDIEATYGPEGYSAFVDPACLGNPASFSYRVTTYYDTNPKDDNADVASDVTPNGGMSFPIARRN